MQSMKLCTLAATRPFSSFPSGGATTYRRPKPFISAATNQLRHPSRHHQIGRSMPPEKAEVFKSLESYVSDNILPILKPVTKCWQPNELLPDPAKPVEEFMEDVRALREGTNGLADEYFVVLVGDMITEDALPSNHSLLNALDGIRDGTGASPNPWAAWVRAWSAEENRHGDLLKTYLYLSGRVDMFMVERTMQYLIRSGTDFGCENNPYNAFVYTSFQERATFVSNGNMARLAKEGGNPHLAKICGTIAADEKRHENAYVRIIEKLLEVDPNETMLAIGNMMRKKIPMPGHLMHDGRDPHLFDRFSYVATRLGVYSSYDYADILEFLIERWRLEKLEGLKEDGRLEQEFVCNLAPWTRKVQERAVERAKNMEARDLKFSWIFDKNVHII